VSTDIIHETVYNEGKTYFQALLRDIENAAQSIEIESYIFSNDTIGHDLVKALCNAARRGVSVRVLVDGAGSPFFAHSLAPLLEKSGAKTKIFHPFPWQLWNFSRSAVRWPLLLRWIYLLLKSNSRNHRKICILDQSIAYIGSINISSHHIQTSKKGHSWRDASIRITGIPLTDLLAAFDQAWHHRSIKERLRDTFKHVKRNPTIRLNNTWHRRRVLYRNLLKRMRRARSRIWICNAYFVPDNFLLRCLKESANCGVDVRVLLPKKSDVLMIPWASEAFYMSLLKAGVRIFEYLPNNLHAKVLFIDDWVLVGSSNLNYRSILHDLEVDIALSKESSKALLEKQFLDDLNDSDEIELKNWEKRHFYQRFLGKLLLHIKYWI
jgi:cardiolipin synthase A/B